MDTSELSVKLLHNYPDLMDQCCKLINSEWPRSTTARMRSLESSRDNLPTCLVLLDKTKVIGHCKLSFIPSIPEACFVESVIIDNKLRGLGLGTYLMNKAEEYCRDKLDLKEVYLSTKGQEKFYSKLGYTECEPITIFGTFRPVTNVAKSTANNFSSNPPPPPPPMPKKQTPNIHNIKTYMKKNIESEQL